MTIAIYEFDRNGQIHLVGDSLIFKADNRQNKVWCYTDTPDRNGIPVQQEAAKEFLGVSLVQCPNSGRFSAATSDTFYWRPINWERHPAFGQPVTIKLRLEECTICAYSLTTEGDPILTASFYPERGGHSGIPHPDRTYMPDPFDEVIVKDARYDTKKGSGIIVGSNQGTLGILCVRIALNHRSVVASVQQSVRENFPGAEILHAKDRVLIFQDGPAGPE